MERCAPFVTPDEAAKVLEHNNMLDGAGWPEGYDGNYLLRSAALPGDKPTPDYVVAVHGTYDNGYKVVYYSGRTTSLPTPSEWRAECGEYRSSAGRVGCNVERKVTYRWVRELKRTLAARG